MKEEEEKLRAAEEEKTKLNARSIKAEKSLNDTKVSHCYTMTPSTFYNVHVTPSTFYNVHVTPSTLYNVHVTPSTLYNVHVTPNTSYTTHSVHITTANVTI